MNTLTSIYSFLARGMNRETPSTVPQISAQPKSPLMMDEETTYHWLMIKDNLDSIVDIGKVNIFCSKNGHGTLSKDINSNQTTVAFLHRIIKGVCERLFPDGCSCKTLSVHK